MCQVPLAKATPQQRAMAMAMATHQAVGQSNASGFWYEQGHERCIRASGVVMVKAINQAVGYFKANTGQSNPVALQLLLLPSIKYELLS